MNENIKEEQRKKLIKLLSEQICGCKEINCELKDSDACEYCPETDMSIGNIADNLFENGFGFMASEEEMNNNLEDDWVRDSNIEKEIKIASDNFAWVDRPDFPSEILFTFDGEQFFNLFVDYPHHHLTPIQIEAFNRKNPFWHTYFKINKDNQSRISFLRIKILEAKTIEERNEIIDKEKRMFLAEEKMKEIISNSKYKIDSVNVHSCGDASIYPLYCYEYLCGGPLHIRPGWTRLEDLLHEDWHIVYDAFSNYDFSNDKKIEINEEVAQNTLKSYFEKSLEHGFIIIPIAFSKLNDEKYSPDILHVLDDDIYKDTDKSIKLLTQFGIGKSEFYKSFYKKHNKRIRHITVELKDFQSVSKDDYFDFVKMIEKLFEVYNDFVKEKYEIYKDDPKYQHRYEGEIS